MVIPGEYVQQVKWVIFRKLPRGNTGGVVTLSTVF